MSGISFREVAARTKTAGIASTSRRAVRRLYGILESRMDLRSLDFPLDDTDIAKPAEGNSEGAPRRSGMQSIAWLCTPPAPGSGGHTTFFRIVRGMEERGHRCTILLYNRHGGDMDRHRAVIRRSWPELTAEITAVPATLAGFDACVASSWDTAHVLAARTPEGSQLRSYYFVQDYEPYFYPRGSLYSLAEDSYRLGFTHLALGPMVAGTLRREVGVDAHTIPFGSDLSSYRRTNSGERSGVVFFARPGVDRRGYDLGRLALQEFHGLHPEQEIHVYGSRVRGWGIPLIQHGTLSARELNQLYNQTAAGLALSFTNITLVAAEMLAAGNLAVLNDHEFSRQVLTNPEAVWAAPSPSTLAAALSGVVTDPAQSVRSARAAAHSGPTWADVQAEVALMMTGSS